MKISGFQLQKKICWTFSDLVLNTHKCKVLFQKLMLSSKNPWFQQGYWRRNKSNIQRWKIKTEKFLQGVQHKPLYQIWQDFIWHQQEEDNLFCKTSHRKLSHRGICISHGYFQQIIQSNNSIILKWIVVKIGFLWVSI